MFEKKNALIVRRDNLETEFMQLKKENDLFKTEVKKIHSNLINAETLNSEYYSVNQSLNEELTTAKETVDLLKVQLNHLQYENNKLSKSIENFSSTRERLDFMEQEHRHTVVSESKLRSELLELRAQYDELTMVNQHLEKTQSIAQEEARNASELLDEKTKEIEVYYGVINKLENVHDDTKRNYVSVKELLLAKENELSTLISELDETKEMLEEHQAMNNDLIETKNLLSLRLEEASKENASMNDKMQKQLANMRNTNTYNEEIENKLLVTMNDLEEKNRNLTSIMLDYEELEKNYKKCLETLKEHDFVSLRYETMRADIVRERTDLNAEIENLQSSVVTLNKALAEKDDYIYGEEELHRQQLARNHDVIERLLKENKNLVSKEQETVHLTQLLDQTNATLLAKTKLFEDTISELEAQCDKQTANYNEEKEKVEALIIQVKEDYAIMKRLQNGLDASVGPLNSYVIEEETVVAVEKEPIKPIVSTKKHFTGRLQRRRVLAKHEPPAPELEQVPAVHNIPDAPEPVVQKKNSAFIDSLLEVKKCDTETSTDLTASNIDLLFETEQTHISLNSQYSDLQASYEKLKQSADRISKSNIEITSKLEKLSKDNKNVLERYDVKVGELTDIIEQDEKEIARLNKEHNSTIKQYESDIEDLKDSIKSYEKSMNELNVFKDEQETVYISLNETIKNQKLELLNMKNQIILQKTHENSIMESYNEQLSKNDDLSKENKNLKLNVYDHDNTIELLKSKLDAISNHNANLVENENEQSRITKEQYSLITELRNEKEDFENKYTKLKYSLNEEYIPLEEHKSILLKYKEELKNLVDENTEYGISEGAYKETIKQYNDEIEQLNITVNNGKTAYNLLQQRLQEIQRKESTLKASLKKFENEAEHAKYEVVTLKEELSSKTRIMDDMMSDKESLQDIMVRLENSKKENERLQKELETTENEKENVFADYESQKEALSHLNNLCDEQRNNISSLKDTLKTSNESLKVVSQRVDELMQEKKVLDEQYLYQMSELKNNFVVERASMKDLERDLNEAVEKRDIKIRVLEKDLFVLKEEFENKNNILEEFEISSDKNKEKEENLQKIIEEYENKIKNLEIEINNFSVKEQQLHDEIHELEQEKKSYGSRLADAVNAERERAKENMITINEDSEALRKLEKKVEVQSSLIQKLRDSEKALRDNDNLMQDHIKSMVSEKETLREEVSKLKQLNTTFITRVKKNNEEKQELEQSCETLKSTIIEYVETVKKMSKNEYDHAYLRNQIHHQEKNFAAFI
ncbi:hypothetical protein N9064_00780 [bacterium]|nr:hypothetical protein [bacterium]